MKKRKPQASRRRQNPWGELTDDQTKAAVFWQFAPIALWNRLARDLADRYDLDSADQARLYGSINLAGTDAAIACWNDKYHYRFWRPRAAIREADTDGNSATVADGSVFIRWHSAVTHSTASNDRSGCGKALRSANAGR